MNKIEFVKSAEDTLVNNILGFWQKNTVDNENGGFYGSIDFYGKIDKTANKGAILNARILWTFSKAFNVLGKKEYLDLATRAYEYINKNFKDDIYNGIYFEIDYQGKPVNDRKYCYTQGFWIYALSEYYIATKKQECLDLALNIFSILEDKAFDKERNGYVEAFARNWTATGDVRLSTKDLNENKTYNTHLHLLEGYTALYHVSKNTAVKKALETLVNLMLEKFYNPKNHHFLLFFDDDWNNKSDMVSYGHDIEGSWLLWEAVQALGSEELKTKSLPAVLKIAEVSAKESIDTDGGQFYEGTASEGVKDTDKHWWPQAETVIGFLNYWEITGNEHYFELAQKTWDFTNKYIIDRNLGEWHWRVNKNNEPYTNEVRAGFWKCPYHNSRACFEILKRVKIS